MVLNTLSVVAVSADVSEGESPDAHRVPQGGRVRLRHERTGVNGGLSEGHGARATVGPSASLSRTWSPVHGVQHHHRCHALRTR